MDIIHRVASVGASVRVGAAEAPIIISETITDVA